MDVWAVRPGGLVPWEVPHGHVIGRLVEVHLEEVNVSPSVVIAGLEDEVVGVPGVHGLVPGTVPLKLVGVQEPVPLGILDEEVANHRRLGRHGHVGDLVVGKAGPATVDGVARKVVAFNPQRDLAFEAFVGQVVVVARVVGRGRLTVAVQRDGDVFVGVGQAVAVQIVVVFDPEMEVEGCGWIWKILAGHANLLVGLWNHPRVVEQGSPVGINVGIGPWTQDLQVEEVRLVGVDGDVKGNGTGLVGVVRGRRAQQFTAVVATNGKAVGLAAGCCTKINVPVEIAADHTGPVGDLLPLHGDVAVGGVDVLQLKHQEVGGRVGGFVQILKANLTDEVDVLPRFCTAQGLGSTDAVLELKGRDTCIVFHGVSSDRLKEHGVRKSVDAVGGREASIHANSGGVVPSWVHTEVPRDLLAVGDVSHRGGGFELDVVVLVTGLGEGHELTP